VATYRIYVLGADGKIRKSIELDCETDAQAEAFAEGHRGPVLELWNLARLVRKFPALDRT
jgi:hypothetical protein